MDHQLGARIANLRRACGLTQEALDGMERLLREYPGDGALRLSCAGLMGMMEWSYPDDDGAAKATRQERRRALYEEAALSGDAAQRESAVCALAAMDLQEDKLNAAQARLDALPEHTEDTTLLRVQILKKRGELDQALEVTQKQLYRAVLQTLERLTLLMEVQPDAHAALQTAHIYRQVEAIFSVGGGMSCGLIMQQYLRLGETEKALECLNKMVESAVGPAMTPNPALFYPTLAPKKRTEQTPKELRAMLLRGLREDEAFDKLRDTQAYRKAVSRLEESLKK